MPLLHRARLEEPLHRRRGIAVLSDQRFERSLFPKSGRVLSADCVEPLFPFSFSRALFADGAARLLDLGLQARKPLADRLEFHGELSATSTEGIDLRVSRRDFL